MIKDDRIIDNTEEEKYLGKECDLNNACVSGKLEDSKHYNDRYEYLMSILNKINCSEQKNEDKK